MSERTEYTCDACGKKVFSGGPVAGKEGWSRTSWDSLWFSRPGLERREFLSCSRECRLKQLRQVSLEFNEFESAELLEKAAQKAAQKADRTERDKLEAKVAQLEAALKTAYQELASKRESVTFKDLRDLLLELRDGPSPSGGETD